MENQTNEAAEQAVQAPQISQEKLSQFMEKLRLEQNLPMGVVAGIVACLVSAGIWALITVLTKYQIGYMAIGVGFLVGFAVRFAGKGIDKVFGIIAALLSFLGCVLGNIFTIVYFGASEMSVTFTEMFSLIEPASYPSLLFDTGSPMDLLFYGLAIYFGYKVAFRPVTEEELARNAAA